MSSPSLNAPFSSYQAKLPHSGFNIGRRFLFTAAPHQILPVFSQVCNPGDKFQINTAANVQMQKIIKPAHLMIDQRVEWFFVPMSMIYTPFPNLMYETNDLISSAVDTACDFPLVDIRKIFSSKLPITQWANDLNEANLKQTKLPFNSFSNSFLPVERFDTFAKGAFRLLMHLGYNPFIVGASQYSDWLDNGEAWQYTLQGDWQPAIFPAHAAAYQCIYQNYPFFRNDDREKRLLRSYQLDYLAHGIRGYVHSDLPYDDFKALFSLHYCQRPKDYFTSMRVNPIMSALNVLRDQEGSGADLLQTVNNYLDDCFPMHMTSEEVGIESSHFAPSVTPVTQYGVSQMDEGTFSTGMLRSVFAVEKLMRITGRAKKDYDSQILAHFGFKVPHDVKHDLTHIGGFEGSFDVQRIIATSNTAYDGTIDNTNLGELGGNGYGSIKGKPLSFTAPCHGILMAVYYTVCRNSYPLGRMIDRQTVLTDRLSFYQPEFDRLGDQPLFGYEACIMTNNDDTRAESEMADVNSLQLGWSRRYEHFKRKYDVHSLAFSQPFMSEYQDPVVNSWSPWVLGRQPFYNLALDIDSNTNDITNAYPQGYDFMGSPTDLDNIMVQQYKTFMSIDDFTKPWLAFQTDPFMVALTTDVKMISCMSVTGEPELD